MSILAFDHQQARHAASRLDDLADRLDNELRDCAAALRPKAAALDPVSVATAATFGVVAEGFHHSYHSGLQELRSIAATLRAHSDAYGEAEDQAADGFRQLA